MFPPSDFISLFFSYCLTLSLIVLLRSLQFCPDASYIWSHFPQSIAYATIRMDFLKHDSICFIHLLKINQRLFCSGQNPNTHLPYMKNDFKAQFLLYLLPQGLQQNNGCYMFPHSKNEAVYSLCRVSKRVAKPVLQPSTYLLLTAKVAEISACFSLHPPSTPRHTGRACVHKDSQELGRKRLFSPLYRSPIAGCLKEMLVPWNLLGKETGTNPTA